MLWIPFFFKTLKASGTMPSKVHSHRLVNLIVDNETANYHACQISVCYKPIS